MNLKYLCAFFALMSGCKSLRFANQDLRSHSVKMFIPAANDTTTRGGQSSRISKSVRQILAAEGRVLVVSRADAEYILQLHIVKSTRSPTQVSDCVRLGEGEVIAAGAFACSTLKDSVVRPDVAVEAERLSLDIRATISNLATGKAVVQKSYSGMSSDYALVGNDTTKQDLAQSPEMHSLRYFENVDDAATNIGRNIAAQLISEIRNLP